MISIDYLVALQSELAHKMQQRDQIQAELDSLEEDITRLDTQISLERERQTRSTRASSTETKTAEVIASARPDLSAATLQDAALLVLSYFNDVMDAVQITANVRLFGYKFRASTSNPQASVNAALSQLVASGRVRRVATGRYVSSEAESKKSPEKGDSKAAILSKIRELETRLPFVGLTLFRDRYLPQIVGPAASDRERHDVINDLAESGAVEIYTEPNPSNPERGTAAIRLAPKRDGTSVVRNGGRPTPSSAP